MLEAEDQEDLSPALFKKSQKQKSAIKARSSTASAPVSETGATSEVFRPKKPTSSRSRTNTSQRRPVSNNQSIYSTEYLSSLRDSTPTTPQAFIGAEPIIGQAETTRPDNDSSNLESAGDDTNIVIPEPSQVKSIIAERELRRRAGENYIPLSDALSLELRDRSDTGGRIQTEDEVDVLGGDGTEGLNGYESDTLPLGDQRLRAAKRDKRNHMQSMIEDVEGTDFVDDSGLPVSVALAETSDDSDDEWERTQVRKSAAGASQGIEKKEQPTICVPEIVPLPTIPQVLAALKARLEIAKNKLEYESSTLAAIEAEQLEIANREEAIKVALQHASLNFETARLKVGGLDVIGDQG